MTTNTKNEKKNKIITGPCIGIDLGTTYSCVGIYKNGVVEIIANDQGNRTTPSYVAFTDTERLIGEAAKTQASSNPKNTIYDSKRLIGRKYDDTSVQSDLRHFPFIVKNVNNKPIISVEFCNEKKDFAPEQISSMILTKMKQTAEAYLGTTVKNAVITCPAYFNDSQRQATKDAGEIAGLNVLRIINEPTAAAMAYGLDKKNLDKNVLIFDLGGGTLDVSVLHIADGIYEVKSTSGDTHLGGEDFDNLVVIYCLKEFAKKYKYTEKQTKDLIENPKVCRRLRTSCENAKKILSSSTVTNIDIESLHEGNDLNIKLTRAKFEDLCQTEFDRCYKPLDIALKDAKLQKDEIEDIVLVGGSTRIPKIRTMIKEYFNKEPKMDVNPDEAVAYGAAVQASILKGDVDSKTTGLVLVDVAPLSLGIETAGGFMEKLIERCVTIPCTKEKTFSTFSDNQPSVTIKIFEGERTKTQDNNILGTFELTGIPPMPRGVPRIKVKFELDANSILQVTAIEESTGKSNNVTIKNEKGRLTDDEIHKMLQEAEKYAITDKELKDKCEAKNAFENYLYNVKTSTNSIEFKNNIGDKQFEEIIRYTIEGLQWMEEHGDASKSEIEKEHKNVENKIMPIMTSVYDKSNKKKAEKLKKDTEITNKNNAGESDEHDNEEIKISSASSGMSANNKKSKNKHHKKNKH